MIVARAARVRLPRGRPRRAAGGRWEVDDAEDAARAVERLVALDADFVKVHELLPREALAALAPRAHAAGLAVVGHVPRGVPYEDALALGVDGFEHANQLAETLLPGGTTQQTVDAAVDDLVAHRTSALFAGVARRGTTFTPTLVAPGMLADLVVLDADPLVDVGAVRRVRAVLRAGRLWDRAALDALLAAAPDAHAGDGAAR